MTNDTGPVALVVEHTIKKGFETDYERWLADILEVIKSTPGYMGREVLSPSGADNPYIVLVRFQSESHLQGWLNSSELEAFLDKLTGILEDEKNTVKSGNDVWLRPGKKPPSYKVFLLTIAAIYPVTLIVPPLLAPLFETHPVLKNAFVNGIVLNVIIVALMSLLIMPHLTHWSRRWLFAQRKPKKDDSPDGNVE